MDIYRMDWASDKSEERPLFNQLSIDKSSILDYEAFRELVSLYDLYIIAEEEHYYILDGSDENLDLFKYYWSFYT